MPKTECKNFFDDTISIEKSKVETNGLKNA